MPISGINLTYSNTGVIGTQDGDVQIKLAEDHRPTADYVRQLRAELPRRFPGVTFGFLPADIISQILNFGAPAPIDVQSLRREPRRRFRLRQSAAEAHPPYSRRRRRAHPAIPRQSDPRRRRRSHARPICRTDRARRHQQPGRRSRRQRPGVADLLARSQERRLLFDRHADAAIPARHVERFADGADLGGGRRDLADSRRPRQDHANGRQRGRFPVQHPADRADLRDAARTRPRRGRRRHRQAASRHRGKRPQGRRRGDAGTGSDDERRLFRPAVRLDRRDRADLSADRGEFPVLGRSVRDRLGAAGRSGGHRLDAVRQPHHPLRARP